MNHHHSQSGESTVHLCTCPANGKCKVLMRGPRAWSVKCGSHLFLCKEGAAHPPHNSLKLLEAAGKAKRCLMTVGPTFISTCGPSRALFLTNFSSCRVCRVRKNETTEMVSIINQTSKDDWSVDCPIGNWHAYADGSSEATSLAWAVKLAREKMS